MSLFLRLLFDNAPCPDDRFGAAFAFGHIGFPVDHRKPHDVTAAPYGSTCETFAIGLNAADGIAGQLIAALL